MVDGLEAEKRQLKMGTRKMKLHRKLILAIGSSGALIGAIGSASADQVIVDDQIVQGSSCVGTDCVNGESFGFDTIRIKENNVRIHFDDTSNSASFPQNDWRLIANDSGNGGANYLAIEDSNSGRIPFRVEAGAAANALVVEADSDIGIGTLNPVVELHVVDGDSPTLRLEQDGSSGFTPQTWDMASNESNFFIRDVTNGSQLPFRIQPGADTDSLFIADDNNVGVGTDDPASALHLVRGGVQQSRGMLQLTNNGGMNLQMENASTSDTWVITHGNTNESPLFIASFIDGQADGAEFTLTTAGDLTISGDLTTGGAGACSSGCDAVFEPDYALPTIEEHAKYMFQNKHLEAVGVTSETGPFNITQKVGGVLNELEKAHIYIAQLNERLAKLEAALAEKK